MAISPGDSFDDAIDRALEQCDVTLAVIGPRWLETRGADGTPRLADPDDYVRRELVAALEHGQQVIPVLVGGAAMPAATALPPELRPLAQRQAVALRDETWHADVDPLIAALAGVDTTRRRSHRVLAVIAVAAAVIIAAIVAVVTLNRSPEDSDSAQAGNGVAADGSTTTFNRPTRPIALAVGLRPTRPAVAVAFAPSGTAASASSDVRCVAGRLSSFGGAPATAPWLSRDVTIAGSTAKSEATPG